MQWTSRGTGWRAREGDQEEGARKLCQWVLGEVASAGAGAAERRRAWRRQLAGREHASLPTRIGGGPDLRGRVGGTKRRGDGGQTT